MNPNEWISLEDKNPNFGKAYEFTDGIYRVLGLILPVADVIKSRPHYDPSVRVHGGFLKLSEFTYFRELDELPEHVKESAYTE